MPLIHDSWMRLKPNEIDGSKEYFDEYYARILKKQDFNHIPGAVFEQWIHAHHDNPYTIRNYAWMDYEKVRFDLVEWPTLSFQEIYVIESFREYVEGRATLSNVSKFMGKKDDLLSWSENGTWRTPPIILDIRSLRSQIPKWSELRSPFQLVEGHTRYGYLKSMIAQSQSNGRKIAAQHSLYLMRIK